MRQPVLLKSNDFRWNFPKEIVVAYPIHPSQHLPARRTKFLRSLEYCGLRSSEYAAGAIRNVKKMVKSARKKSYTLAVGKPNPAKLANIPEEKDAQCYSLDSKERNQAILWLQFIEIRCVVGNIARLQAIDLSSRARYADSEEWCEVRRKPGRNGGHFESSHACR
ncbi:hypothetical protein SELMODRAFT_444508 [Selaginella moellendorffii]|uniref:Uncharacterized protein n=1 Tax=Selaginella moellendorffii TaxID=88036 RepID=D8SA82_SELML|nr:hypothetical protein SELMODRAFT_444508 [Selaginella moellendorffii]